MPWQASTIMSLKQEFVERCLRGEGSISSLCRAYGISRNTAYRLLKRYECDGPDGLIDRRTLRLSRACRYAADVWEDVTALRAAHPTYGPRKLFCLLKERFPARQCPSASLIRDYLRKKGLSEPGVLRRKIIRERLPLRDFTGPNSIWCMDFKGHFFSQDGRRCDTFTLLDGFSRYFLACTPLRPIGFAQVKPVLEKAFEEYGLPEAIRSDNGSPFGSGGLRGLTPLSVWLLKVGIWPEKITPGRPGENGRLERAHRTLQTDLLSQGKSNYSEYQKLFEQFMRTYNTVRPHEALGNKTPAQVYRASPRMYVPERLDEPAYPAEYLVLKVNSKGYLRMPGATIYLTESLANEYVGVGPETEAGRPLLFRGYPLGHLEEHYSRRRK